MPALHAVTVCIGYLDYFKLCYRTNRNLFSTWTVLTSVTDTASVRWLSAHPDIKMLISEEAYSNGSPFNKGRLLNVGLRHTYSSQTAADWTVVMDADIVISPGLKNVNLQRLEPERVYSVKRYIANTPEEYTAVCFPQTHDVNWGELSLLEKQDNSLGWGFLQVFNRKVFYPVNSADAGGSDVLFLYQFCEAGNYPCGSVRVLPDVECIHYGPPGINWRGRKSKQWTLE